MKITHKMMKSIRKRQLKALLCMGAAICLLSSNVAYAGIETAIEVDASTGSTITNGSTAGNTTSSAAPAETSAAATEAASGTTSGGSVQLQGPGYTDQALAGLKDSAMVSGAANIGTTADTTTETTAAGAAVSQQGPGGVAATGTSGAAAETTGVSTGTAGTSTGTGAVGTGTAASAVTTTTTTGAFATLQSAGKTVDAANIALQTAAEVAGTQAKAASLGISQPSIEAQGAVVIDCATGTVLYEKNSHTQFYPASITKVMTALLTVENTNLSDVVTFSKNATTNLESGAVTIDLAEGDTLTVEQSLHALLLKSANEVANGLAEHIGGSIDGFSTLMNSRAAQLGCTGTHFANPNGLNNSTHVTTPYDMALIARAAYANPTIDRIAQTLTYQMPATKNSAGKTITMGHKMLYPSDNRYYAGIVGGKTGYTSKAGNTLVTCVERNGVRLVAVVMKASGTHYTDTKALLDYGFAVEAAGK